MGREKELREEAEAARKRLQEEIKSKEKEADEKLDELLSKRKMEFCPRCGRKINSRMDWGGRCLHEGCEDLVCIECWDSEEKRYCRRHLKDYVKAEETTEDDIKILTLNYMKLVEERIHKFGLDWTPDGFIRKTKAKVQNKRYKEFEMVVYEKRMFSKKSKLRVLVKPISVDVEAEVNSLIEDIGDGVYTVIALVGNASSMNNKIKKFANEFSNKVVSLFLMDMENGIIYFNQKEKISEKYASWFDPTKTPKRFEELLRSISESVSGRKIIEAKSFGEHLGKSEEEAAAILRSSGLLDEVSGTNSFIIKE